MSEEEIKKKPVRAVDVFMDDAKKSEIDDQYKSGKTIKELAVIYDMSFNTMMIVLGMMGYTVEPWCTDSINKKLEYVKKFKADRVKQ